MFNIFRRFACCKKPSRTLESQKCGRCTREAIDINEITYEKLLEKVNEGAVLIDVRTKQEFLEGHLNGAILIPYYEIYRNIQNIIPNKEQTIIVYCQNGGRSQKAYEILNRLGYKNLFNLKNGIKDLQ